MDELTTSKLSKSSGPSSDSTNSVEREAIRKAIVEVQMQEGHKERVAAILRRMGADK